MMFLRAYYIQHVSLQIFFPSVECEKHFQNLKKKKNPNISLSDDGYRYS